MEIHVAAVDSHPGLAVWSDVHNRVVPHDPLTVEEVAHIRTAERDCLLLLASQGAEPAGGAIGTRSTTPGCLHATVFVLPAARRRGVGTALYEALSAHARRLGLAELQGTVVKPEAIAFAERLGFREVARECEVSLAVASAPREQAAVPEGIALVSLAERPDLAAGAWAVERDTVGDIPTPEPLTPPDLARWTAQNLEAPGAEPAACFVALAGAEVVGYAGLRRLLAAPATADHRLTAVRREWRGRGVARALKQAQIAWARQAGVERLVTANDATNTAMRRVNERLGYEPEPVQIVVRGPLAPPPHGGYARPR